jgi:uncharacterized protein YndB with AHSA1/START domain
MELGPGGLTPGTRLAMRTPNGKNTGVVGAILEIVPLKRFAHTFQFTSEHEPPCVVTYTLAEVSGGTEFTLTITDCADGSKTQKQMVQGSSIIVNTLKAVLETGRPSFGIRMLFLLIKLMPAPNRCRSEHWPVG